MLESDLRNIDLQLNSVFLVEIERTKLIMKDAERQKDAFKIELNDLEEMNKKKSDELKERETKEKESRGLFRTLSVKRTKLTEDTQKTELKISDLELKNREGLGKINDIRIERAAVIAKLETFQKEFEQYSDGIIRRGVDIDILKSEIKEFENMLANFGNVNLRALEIYEDLENQHKEMTEKIEKLKKEREDVLLLIKEIDEKKRDVFMKTFNEVAGYFREIFLSLSTKGEAYLDLENRDDPFAGGVEFKVKLTGTKFLDIKSLSGGEKTMTALAFIFAIQEYEPASFYLMDEVDAALDKRNSDELAKLIKKYSQKAQYIVISHNDTIISDVDQLYGVSMQEGVSKIIGLKF